MTDKLTVIKNWLGSGAINIFGVPFSGKDTLGIPLAKQLGATFISSGDIVRAAVTVENQALREAALSSQTGVLTPTDEYRQLIIPYLKSPQFANQPLVLGSVGRWIGEEEAVMQALADSHHPLKAVIVLNITDGDIWQRWVSDNGQRNGGRIDDQDKSVIERRLDEFRNKTLPVIDKYRQLGLVVDVDATDTIAATFDCAIDSLFERAIST